MSIEFKVHPSDKTMAKAGLMLSHVHVGESVQKF